jgi:hypothetical protein
VKSIAPRVFPYLALSPRVPKKAICVEGFVANRKGIEPRVASQPLLFKN